MEPRARANDAGPFPPPATFFRVLGPVEWGVAAGAVAVAIGVTGLPVRPWVAVVAGLLALHQLQAAVRRWLPFVGVLVAALWIASSGSEMLVLSAIVWVPALLANEWRIAREYRNPAMHACRLGLLPVLLLLAAAAPLKPLDRRVGPFAKPSMTLGELADTLHVQGVRLRVHEIEARTVTVPRGRCRLAALIDHLNSQHGIEARATYCGFGGPSLLTGIHLRYVRVCPRREGE